MRVKSSLINITAGIGNQLVITALSFVSRTVFINMLGVEYLGINGLFTNILLMLTLAEAGIGSSIMYSLYKPVAGGDHDKIVKLMRLYRKAYLYIALVVASLGLALLPFLGLVVKDTSIEHVNVIYLIFLVNTVAPYLFVYKNSFLNVNQKGYIVTLAYTVTTIFSTCLKIAVLYYTQNYILFLAIDSAITIGTAIYLVVVVDRMYPFLRNKVEGRLDSETKNGIVKNVKAIVLQNIGGYLVLGAENILISTFVSLVAVGLYSNYKMLIDIGRTFINQVFNNMYHSIGNLVASETSDEIYRVYQVMFLLSFWLYSLFAILMYVLIEPFITIWIGKEYLIASGTLIILMLLFFERGMRNPISTVKTTAGIFHEDRFVPIAQAAVSLTISVLLVRHWGIAGIFIGSLISVLALPFWTTPYLVYKKVFHKSVWNHYYKYFLYTAIGLGAFFLAGYGCSFIETSGFFSLLLKAAIAFIAVNLTYILVFHRTEEFSYLAGILKTFTGKFARLIKMKQKMEV